ncbi:helicase associated domain-containing protein [Sinomonas sp.]|jgi:hypothetical protein|uniref:helicase associated domain-containing protein n=1 Tax=Sinomonas sp. TaxID=1914986 RepID=UPI002CFC12B3|nr:helicase associated domain-containing protein [Sinomonas sp.]
MDGMTRRELARQIAGISDPPQDADALFARTLQRLAAFHRTNARTPEPTAGTLDEARLGRWLEAQRADLRRGTLCDERRSQLDDAIGGDWALR